MDNRKEEVSQIVVKFRDDIDIPYEDGVEGYLHQKVSEFELEPDIIKIKFKKLFNSLSPDKIKELITKGEERDSDTSVPNLLSYFKVECPEGVDPNQLVKHLSNWPIVQAAYVDTPAHEPERTIRELGTVNPSNDPLFAYQRYLRPSPEGIDVEYAWRFPGGDGAGQSVIDVERGWTLNHEDLIHLNAQLLFGNIRDESRGHGTAVLGEIAAKDSQIGCIGIVPNLKSVHVVSYHGVGVHDAILAAIPHLEAGNLLILEVETKIGNLPIEVNLAEFDVIRLAIKNGIVVLEAAGNGGVDLDQYKINGKRIFNRASQDFRDSGAIIVGASSAMYPHKRMSFSNYG